MKRLKKLRCLTPRTTQTGIHKMLQKSLSTDMLNTRLAALICLPQPTRWASNRGGLRQYQRTFGIQIWPATRKSSHWLDLLQRFVRQQNFIFIRGTFGRHIASNKSITLNSWIFKIFEFCQLLATVSITAVWSLRPAFSQGGNAKTAALEQLLPAFRLTLKFFLNWLRKHSNERNVKFLSPRDRNTFVEALNKF